MERIELEYSIVGTSVSVNALANTLNYIWVKVK
jgi:hypothetical protein